MKEKKKKLVGELVMDKLSGKKGVVLEKIKKDRYRVRVWVPECSSWVVMECPTNQFQTGTFEEKNKIGFKYDENKTK